LRFSGFINTRVLDIYIYKNKKKIAVVEYKEDLSNSLMAQAISSKEGRLVLLQQYSQPPPRSAVVAPLPFMVKRIGQGE
jgi:hypothetical protein